jgi:hypothetical protein
MGNLFPSDFNSSEGYICLGGLNEETSREGEVNETVMLGRANPVAKAIKINRANKTVSNDRVEIQERSRV